MKLKMSLKERDEIIMILHLRTGWSMAFIEKMTDAELKRTTRREFESSLEH